MVSTKRVALITGGASGMGAAVVESLVHQNWNDAIFDLNKELGAEVAYKYGDSVLLTHGNVGLYQDQAKAFHETLQRWGRLDFVFANAGMGDRIDFFEALVSEDGQPIQPDVLPLHVCLTGVLWSSHLALHYFKKNPGRTGKLVIFASSTGIYPHPEIPIYSAAKCGVVGLTRSLAKRMKKLGEAITINCHCPDLVATPIVSEALIVAADQAMLTPMSTIIRCIDMILADDTLNGAVLESSGKDIIPRAENASANKEATYLLGEEFVGTTDSVGERDS